MEQSKHDILTHSFSEGPKLQYLLQDENNETS